MKTVIVTALTLVSASAIFAQRHDIDPKESTLTIHVGKTGSFSAFGHNHEIQAPIEHGAVEEDEHPSVELRVAAKALQVMDRDASEKDRALIQKTMVGPDVLDSDKFPEIVFQSSGVTKDANGKWTVSGKLSLHGATRPITVEVNRKDGHYTGQATLKQSDFGITPVKVGGGAVKVKDELRIDFDIRLRP